MSRSFTGRSVLHPAGFPANRRTAKQDAYLNMHNEIANRCALLVRTAICLDVQYVIEQPRQSSLFQYPPIMDAMKCDAVITAPMCMEAFGGDTPKPLGLRGNACLLELFKQVATRMLRLITHKPTKRLTLTGRSPCGKVLFTGRQKEMKASSAYERGMAIAVALCFNGEAVDDIVVMTRNAM